MNVNVKILPEGRTVEAAAGRTLADSLGKNGIRLSLYCGQRGICGKCFVEILRGEVGEPDPIEKRFIEGRGLSPRSRMSCRYRPSGDIAIRIPPGSLLPDMPVFKTGFGRRVIPDPAVKKIALTLPEIGEKDQNSLLDRIRGEFRRERPLVPAGLLRDFALAARDRGWAESTWTAVLYDDRELLDIEPGDTGGSGVGLAVDLGTTTLAAEAVELDTGKILAAATSLNPQTSFGSDVVSRITSGFMDPRRVEAMRDAAVHGINGLIAQLEGSCGLAPTAIHEAVIAGNTAMNHLLLGMPVFSLAVSPYSALFSILPPLPAAETGLRIHPRGKVYIAPNIRSFVGGDIAAGLVAVDFEHLPGNHLFADLGTNGEIVLKHGSSFTATSTAAGPAFEGMSISCGMLALPGAVHRAAFRGGSLSVRTIGGGRAHGICGTGLIDVVAAAIRRGMLTSAGHIVDPSKRIPFAPGLFLTQKDIREVQLAAAAVKAGMKLLLADSGLSVGDLDGLIVAGAFGNEMNIDHAISIGLLPRIGRKRVHFVGNSALAGARAFLLSREERLRGERLASRVEHLSLAQDETFQRTFVEALELSSWPEEE